MMSSDDQDQTRALIGISLAIGLIISMVLSCNGQCPTFSFEGTFTDTQCYDDSLSVSDTLVYDCPSFYHGGGFIYEFTTTGYFPVSIIVDSDLSYTSCPDCDVWCHAFIIDECGGNTLWSSGSNYCFGDYVSTTAPSQDWILDIQLEAGTYYLVIGNVGTYQTNHEINGCFTLYIGEYLFLTNILENSPNGLVVRNKLGTFDLLGRRIK
ncbi:MAG: hypothetical protein Unbinned1473contig1000_48 [Prokaryotic dsDNA virus sp.]|nr:MAG: hypothetical protein Unbinned1473contig1000_48 [Prokaryotic dsDNA virus sp.]|tara:strand:- start:8913 stop:9539 length:627 start_codon:yes stop_codon:yes gene_type:complete